MIKKKRYLIIAFLIIFLVVMEGVRLHYIIDAVKVSKEIKVVKNENKLLEKDISSKKIELAGKMNLDTIRANAKNKLNMESSDTIKYIKIVESVSNQN